MLGKIFFYCPTLLTKCEVASCLPDNLAPNHPANQLAAAASALPHTECQPPSLRHAHNPNLTPGFEADRLSLCQHSRPRTQHHHLGPSPSFPLLRAKLGFPCLALSPRKLACEILSRTAPPCTIGFFQSVEVLSGWLSRVGRFCLGQFQRKPVLWLASDLVSCHFPSSIKSQLSPSYHCQPQPSTCFLYILQRNIITYQSSLACSSLAWR